jgi:hypothetical protein
MSDDRSRFVFSGHAIGAAAQFHKLDRKRHLNHVIPALGPSVLPPTGGVSKSQVSDFQFEVSYPRRRSLLTVHRIETMAAGRSDGNKLETETEARIESISIVDKLHIDLVQVHVLATREGLRGAPKASTRGNKIEGFHLGNVTAIITLDNEALAHCGTAAELTAFHKERGTPIEAPDGVCTFSLVRDIRLRGPEKERRLIHVEGNAIHWENFGWIFLAEVIVRQNDRQVTMVRLQMGSDAGGSGTVGDGQSNGHVITG